MNSTSGGMTSSMPLMNIGQRSPRPRIASAASVDLAYDCSSERNQNDRSFMFGNSPNIALPIWRPRSRASGPVTSNGASSAWRKNCFLLP